MKNRSVRGDEEGWSQGLQDDVGGCVLEVACDGVKERIPTRVDSGTFMLYVHGRVQGGNGGVFQ